MKLKVGEVAKQGYNKRELYGSRQVIQSTPSGSLAIESSEFARSNYGKRKNKRPPKRHTGVKVFFLLLLVAILAAAGVVGYYGNQFYQSVQHVRTQASEAMSDLSAIKADIVAGDMEGAQKAAASLSQKAREMNEETDGDLWVIAEKIPTYGEDIATVRTLTDVLEDVSVNALEPLCGQLTGFSLKSLVGEDRSVNVEQISALVNELSAVSPVLKRSAEAFNKCPEPHFDQLKDIISKASTELNSANDMFDFANRFAPLIPDVFGANGTRNYLVVAQNNVEVRATGGFYGAAGMASIEDGRISIGSFSSLAGSPYDQAYTNSGLAGTYDRVGIVDFPATNLYNLGTNPDIPHVAQVLADACSVAGYPIDGVVFCDPVFVQILVGFTGGFTADDGTELTGENTAQAIMHDTYWTYFNQSAAQDAFFTMVASNAISHVFSSLSGGDLKDFIETVMDAGEKRHISIWFADADEQAAIAELGFSGSIPNDPAKAETGIYFTNESWSKMEWYLRASTEVTPATKNDDGSMSFGVTLTLYNAISDEEAYSGNWYVVGGNGKGNSIMYQPGDMLERVYLVAPSGGDIRDVEIDGDVYDSDWGALYDDVVMRQSVHLLPGETVTITYTVVTSPEAEGDLIIDMTPLAQDAW